MKHYALFIVALFVLMTSCMSYKSAAPYQEPVKYAASAPEDNITQSLFDDKDSKITEENIRKILDGKYSLPQHLRVAVVNIDNRQSNRYYWNDEDYLSSRQRYLTTLTSNMEQQRRVQKVSLVPDIMLSSSPTFTSIREAGVRIQADIVLIYSIKGGTYSKYKMFSANEYKAFATTQILIMDVRTGLVPFSTVVTEDYMSKKQKDDFNDSEAEKRIQEEAVAKTLVRVCDDINSFLNK